MKGQFKVSPTLVLELEAETIKGMFEKLAELQQIFGEKCCGLCNKNNLKFVVRKAKTKKNKEVEYYELQCSDCFAKLSYGQNLDKSNLFTKRKINAEGVAVGASEEGSYGSHNGWHHYNKNAEAEE